MKSWVERENIQQDVHYHGTEVDSNTYPSSAQQQQNNENGVIIYNEMNAKLRSLMDAINRRNDSIYIISITQVSRNIYASS